MRILGAALAVTAVLVAVASVWDAPGGLRDDGVHLPDPTTQRPPDVLADVDVEGLLAGRAADGSRAPDDGAALACLTSEDCERWRASLGPLREEPSLSTGRAGGDLTIVSGSRAVIALDADGQRRWSEPELGRAPERLHGVATTEELVLASVGGRRLVALDASTGDPRWTRQLGDDRRLHVHGARQVGGVVLVELGPAWRSRWEPEPQHVRGFAVDDGRARWGRWAERVLLAGERPVLVDAAGIRGIEPHTGATLWHREPGPDRGDDESPREVTAPAPHVLATADGLLVLERSVRGLADGDVLLLDAVTGQRRAQHDGRVVRQLRADPLVLRQRTGGGQRLVALDAHGRVAWRRDVAHEVCCGILGAPAERFLVLGPGRTGRTQVVDLRDGSLAHEGRLASGTVVYPLGARTLVVGTGRGQGHLAVDLEDEVARWWARDVEPLGAAPPDGDTLLRVGSELVAIADGGFRPSTDWPGRDGRRR